MTFSRLVVPAALVLSLALPASASAGPTWFPASPFAEAGEDFSPSVAVEPDNDAAMAWIGKDAGGAQQVNVATLPAGPGTPTVQSFSRPNAVTSDSLAPPSLAAAPTGDALVAWLEGASATTSRTLAYSLRQAPGTFGAPQTLTAPNTGDKDVFTSPAIVSADGQGGFLVAVGDEIKAGDSLDNLNHDRILVWSIGADGVTTLLAPVAETTAASTQPITELSMAEAPDGKAVIAFRQPVGGLSRVRLSARTSASSTFLPPSEIDTSGNQPRVAIAPDGRELIAWRHNFAQVEAAVIPPGGAVTPVGDTPNGAVSDGTGSQPQVALDSAGRGTIVMCDGCGPKADATHTVGAVNVNPDASLSGIRATLSAPDLDPNDGPSPQLAVNASGAAVAVWKRATAKDGATQLEYARRATATGAWSAAQALPVDAGVSSFGVDFNTTAGRYLGIDSEGNAALGWEHDAVATHTPHLARLDDAPPSPGPIATIGLPATPFSPLTFTLTPTDRVSPTSVAWTFGDGGAAPGTTVRHSYSVGGMRTVAGTATDAAGFAATATETFDLGTVDDGGGVGKKPKPSFTGPVSLSHTHFAVGSKRTALAARKRKKKPKKPPKGTTFHFGLSAAATVKISFGRLATGRRSKGRCVRPTRKLAKAKAHRCTRTIKLRSSLTRKLSKGRRSVAFSGRLGRSALSPARYKATLSASNANGRAKARTLTFTVVRG